MSIRVDSTPWIAGAVVVGDPGLGVSAEAIPSTGENGAGIAYSSLSFPADTGKEVRVVLTSWPSSGTLILYEDTSFEYDGPSFSTNYQLYLDGVAVGTPQVFSVNISATSVNVLPTTSSIDLNGYSSTVVQSVVQQSTGNCQLYVKINNTYLALVL